MDAWVCDLNSEKHKINSGAYITLSEELTDWGYETKLAPNAENVIYNIISGEYDNIFDFSKEMIDIGACMGTYSIELVKNNRFSHSYAFEANKIYSKIVGINSVLNNVCDKVDVFNTFISDKNSKIEYNGWVTNKNADTVNVDYLTHICFETRYTEDHTFKEIPTRTIDSYNFNNIGFIKMDIEGHELEALRGSLKTIINNNYPPILFEMWNINENFITDKEKQDAKNKQLICLLEALGYNIRYGVTVYPNTHLAVHE